MRKGGAVSNAKKYMVLPDAHFPHQDDAAMACVLEAVDIVDPDEIIVLGDWLDAGGFSRHPAFTFEDGKHSYLQDEVGPVNEFLDLLQGHDSRRKLVYLGGNHEYRVQRHLVSVGGAVGKDLFTLSDPARLLRHRYDRNGNPGRTKRKNFKYIPWIGKGCHAHYKIAPNLIAIHGWSFAVNFTQVNQRHEPTMSIVCGHTHRAAVHTARSSITGMETRYWSPGCLCKLHQLYMCNTPHNWTQGFDVIYQSRRRKTDWSVLTIPITNGRAIIPGDAREVQV